MRQARGRRQPNLPLPPDSRECASRGRRKLRKSGDTGALSHSPSRQVRSQRAPGTGFSQRADRSSLSLEFMRSREPCRPCPGCGPPGEPAAPPAGSGRACPRGSTHGRGGWHRQRSETRLRPAMQWTKSLLPSSARTVPANCAAWRTASGGTGPGELGTGSQSTAIAASAASGVSSNSACRSMTWVIPSRFRLCMLAAVPIIPPIARRSVIHLLSTEKSAESLMPQISM